MPEQLTFLAQRDKLDLDWFETLLLQADGWLLAREVLERAGVECTECQRRWLRHLAEQSDRIVSGQAGYCHLEHATAEQIQHAATWLESQAAKMQARSIRLRQSAHRRIHCQSPKS